MLTHPLGVDLMCWLQQKGTMQPSGPQGCMAVSCTTAVHPSQAVMHVADYLLTRALFGTASVDVHGYIVAA